MAHMTLDTIDTGTGQDANSNQVGILDVPDNTLIRQVPVVTYLTCWLGSTGNCVMQQHQADGNADPFNAVAMN